MLHKTSTENSSNDVATPAKRRRVSIFGVMFRLALAIVIVGGSVFYAQMMIADKPQPPKREPRERTFTVQSFPAQYANYQPSLIYFGEVIAGSSLDVRSQVAGKVVQIAPELAVGSSVAKGDLLATIDDFNYRGALSEAQANLAEAKFSLAEAKERLALERANLDFVRSQYDLSIVDLERAKQLLAGGSITQKTVDDRELLVSQRKQAVIQRESNIIIQQAQLDRQEASLERIEWQVERAQRDLEDTKIYAPFDGIITAKNIDEGRVVSNNEVLISLYEASALEVSFTMSDQQYGQLLTDGLVGRPVGIEWEVEPDPITAQAIISRVGAQVDATTGGVEVFAQIQGDAAAQLRPGTFVKIDVPGLAYNNALRILESAIYENSFIYVDIDGRMARRDVQMVARDGAHLIVTSDIEPGTPIITTRLAQAGEGVAIINEGEPAPSPFTRRNAEQRNSEQGEARQRGQGEQAGQGQRDRQGNNTNRRPSRSQGSGEAGGLNVKPSN